MKVTYTVGLLEATINKQVDRIEALEAALRNINDICHDPDHEAACMAAITVARAALAPEQDKCE